MSSLSRLLLLSCLAFQTACASVPLMSMLTLGRIDLPTTDVAALRVAVRLPDALAPSPDAVRMKVKLSVEGEADEAATLPLERVPTEEDRAGLPPLHEDGATTYAYRLGTEGAARLEAVRRAVIAARTAGRKGSFSLEIEARDFCLTGAPLGPRLVVSTYLRSSETGRYVVVTSDVDVLADRSIAPALTPFPPCRNG